MTTETIDLTGTAVVVDTPELLSCGHWLGVAAREVRGRFILDAYLAAVMRQYEKMITAGRETVCGSNHQS